MKNRVKGKMRKRILGIIAALMITVTACSPNTVDSVMDEEAAILGNSSTTTSSSSSSTSTVIDESDVINGNTSSVEVISAIVASEDSALDLENIFTERDLEQTADTEDAQTIVVEDGEVYNITSEGTYIISGEAQDATIKIAVTDEEKVQLLLDGVTITNESAPAIYVLSGDKIFITTAEGSENAMTVTGQFEADGDTNLDAVIFSRSDLVLNGLGSLTIVSQYGNGITSKDDLKVTGGTLAVGAQLDALEANDSIRIYDGDITIATNKDGLHSENDEDLSKGYIYIYGGSLYIKASEDGIDGAGIVQIDGGVINIEMSLEGIEGNYIQINGGDIDIYAADDGINATASGSYEVAIEVNGGTIDVEVGSGDTDAFDSNGNMYINGGVINVTAPTSSFDADGTVDFTGGTVTVNGEKVTEIDAHSMPGGQGGRSGRGH